MAKKVAVTGYVAGGYEFSDTDMAMARGWWNEEGHKTPITVGEGEKAQTFDSALTKGRTPDAVLLAWIEAGEPEVKIARKFAFEQGERRKFNAWLAAEGKENNDDTKAEWFDAGKPAPEGYVDQGPAKANSPEDILAVIYGNRMDTEGNVTDEKVEVNVTRAMLQESRGKGARGAASAEALVTAANVNDEMETVAPVRMVRGEQVLHYQNGAWVGSSTSKKVLANKLSEAEQELMRERAEVQRLKELLEKAEKGINASTVKKAPVARNRTPRAKADAK